MTKATRSVPEMIREFSLAFRRPINEAPADLTVSDRELLGKLMFEECVEYLTKGLGLKLVVNGMHIRDLTTLNVELNEGQRYDPIESADGLGDITVIAYFNALWHGFDLDAIVQEIHDSNMSKLDDDGDPLINSCQLLGLASDCQLAIDDDVCHNPEHLTDPTRPVGKILKGPNYRKPDIASVVFF